MTIAVKIPSLQNPKKRSRNKKKRTSYEHERSRLVNAKMAKKEQTTEDKETREQVPLAPLFLSDSDKN